MSDSLDSWEEIGMAVVTGGTSVLWQEGIEMAGDVVGDLTGANAAEAERERLAAAAETEKATALETRRASLLQQKKSLSKTNQSSASAGGKVSSGTNIKSEYTGTLLG